MGAARRAARGDAQPAAADAAARAQHRRLHAVPDRGHRRVRDRGGAHRHRHLPDLRRAQRRRPDEPGDRRGPRDRHRGRRGVPLLHRQPARPGRAHLHPRLLPRPGRAGGGGRRPRHRDQGHGRAAARPGRGPAGDGAARAVRPAGAPAHPRHRRWPAGHPAGRDRRRRRRGRRGQRLDVRHHQPAVDVGAGRGDRRHRARDRAGPAGGAATSSPTGRACASSTPRSSPAWPPPPVGSTPTRSPAGQLSNLRQQAIALGLGDRFESIEDMYAAANRILGNIVKVTPELQGGRRPRAGPRRRRTPTRPSSRPTRPGSTSPTRSSASSTATSATRPAAGPSRSAAKALEGRTRKPARQRAVGAGARPTSSRRRGARSTGCCSPARPGTSRRPARPTPTCPCSATGEFLHGLAVGAEHEVDLEPGKRLLLGRAVDQRRRRARPADGHVHGQRPAAPGAGARRVDRRRRAPGRAGRPGATPGRSRRRSPAWCRCPWPRATPWRRVPPWPRSRR